MDIATDTLPEPVLAQDVLYMAYDRFVCGRGHCAGMTAQFTGVTIGGSRVTEVNEADITEWASAGLGDLGCECGSVKATLADGTVSFVRTTT